MEGFNSLGALIAGCQSGAPTAAGNASEFARNNLGRDGVTIMNTGTVDLHIATCNDSDATATFTSAQVKTYRKWTLSPGYTLPIGAKGRTRIFIAPDSGTGAWNGEEWAS